MHRNRAHFKNFIVSTDTDDENKISIEITDKGRDMEGLDAVFRSLHQTLHTIERELKHLSKGE